MAIGTYAAQKAMQVYVEEIRMHADPLHKN